MFRVTYRLRVAEAIVGVRDLEQCTLRSALALLVFGTKASVPGAP